MANEHKEKQKLVYVSILTQVYIDPEINNRELADTEEETRSLANSIESTNGLLQPIIIYPAPPARKLQHGFDYELGSGYRRSAALKLLMEESNETDWVEKVPAMLHEATPAADRHIHQLIENLQRKDLKPMEIALAFKKAMHDKDSRMTQKQLARSIAWDESTVSTYLKVANNLNTEVQTKVLTGELPWSSARELAAVVAKHKISDKEQSDLAAIGVGMQVEDFTNHLLDHYKDASSTSDEAAAPGVSTGKEKDGVQRTYTAIRGSDLEKKYIPKLEAMKAEAKNDAEKAQLDIYIDAIKFVLQVDGTSLGAKLDPWEQQLTEEAQERKNSEDRSRHENNYVRKAVSGIKKSLREIPPATLPDGSVNPNREAPTLPGVLERVKATVLESLERGKAAKLDEGTMVEGFVVANVEDFIKKIQSAYIESVKKDKEAAEKREKDREAKKLAKETGTDEAAEKGENAVATASA